MPKPPRTGSTRAAYLKRTYGLTVEDWNEMFEAQDGRCGICLRAVSRRRHLQVDHNAETGKVRQLLCGPCNSMVAFAEHDPTILRAGASYIVRHRKGKKTHG